MRPSVGQLVLLACLLLAASAAQADQDKCDNEKCGWGATCKTVNGRARCRCNEFCPMVHKPICGSDGKTYINYCGMKQAGCHQQEEIVKVNDGECPRVETESAGEPEPEADGLTPLAPGELRRP